VREKRVQLPSRGIESGAYLPESVHLSLSGLSRNLILSYQ
jgi:hypothetical protein